jgi:glycerophosphoryl diester phosphodiesterase
MGLRGKNKPISIQVENQALRSKVDENTARLAETEMEVNNIPRSIETFDGVNKIRFIAHRGLSSISPENSIPAFELAGKNGAWGCETDTQMTSDGIWIIMHDKTVDRTTNGTGNVADLTIGEVKSLKIDFGNNIEMYPNLTVPTLEEYFLVCKKWDMIPIVEIKNYIGIIAYDSFIELVKKHGLENKIIVLSFDLPVLQEIRNRSKKIMLQLVTNAPFDESIINDIKALGNSGIDPNYYRITSKEIVEQYHQAGLVVNTWTVNDYEAVKTMINYGVDFISSDGIMGVK